MRGIHQSPMNSLHKVQWHGALIFSLICACINGWGNNRKASGLKRKRTHYDVTLINYVNNSIIEQTWFGGGRLPTFLCFCRVRTLTAIKLNKLYCHSHVTGMFTRVTEWLEVACWLFQVWPKCLFGGVQEPVWLHATLVMVICRRFWLGYAR